MGKHGIQEASEHLSHEPGCQNGTISGRVAPGVHPVRERSESREAKIPVKKFAMGSVTVKTAPLESSDPPL